MNTIGKRIKYIIPVLAAIILILASEFGVGLKYAGAEASSYTGVSEDLQKDSSFNPADYPANATDYRITVIQIGESDEKELFIYVYRPSAGALEVTLRSIRFSTTTDGTGTTDYKLTLLNSSGTLYKYRVEGFTVGGGVARFYNIVCVHRDFDKILDEGTISANQDSQIAVEVAQLWTVINYNGAVSYTMEKAKVVKLTGFKYGSVRLDSGYNFMSSYACDSHFVAFSTDVQIDKLLEADVTFSERSVDYGVYNHPDYGEWQPNAKTVTYKEKGENTTHLFGNNKRTWDRIMSASEYVDNFPCALPENVAADIKKQQWVLSYYETPFKNDGGGVFGFLSYAGSAIGGANIKHMTEVSNATILRLKYITDGVTYNLGVVSNKGGTSQIVYDEGNGFIKHAKNNIKSFFNNLWNKTVGFFKNVLGGVKWWQWLLIVLAIIIGIPIVLFIIVPGFRMAITGAYQKHKENKASSPPKRKKAKKGRKTPRRRKHA